MMTDAEILHQRRQARAAKRVVDMQLLDLHRRAVQAMEEAELGEQVRQQALRQIEKWDKERLCNPRYVLSWRAIPDLPLEVRGAAILRDDADGLSLRQNSPFGFLVDRGTE